MHFCFVWSRISSALNDDDAEQVGERTLMSATGAGAIVLAHQAGEGLYQVAHCCQRQSDEEKTPSTYASKEYIYKGDMSV